MKSIVLLSAGLDSTVNLYHAMSESTIARVLTFNYGQKAAQKEIEKASEICRLNGLSHTIIDLPWFKEMMGQSSLIDQNQSIPVGSSVSIDNILISQKTAKSVWVPNRNGIFLNIAAGFAESLNADTVIPGFNLEEAQTFPDNSQCFMSALDHAFSFSTANHVKVKCYTVSLTKSEIVKQGVLLKVPFDKIWPCYFNLDQWCGECESCLCSKRAFSDNKLSVNQFVK